MWHLVNSGLRRIDAAVKVHLILGGYAFCNTSPREGGYQAVRSASDFDKVEKVEQCKKCASKLQTMRLNTKK